MANRFQSVTLHAAVSPAATRDRLLGEPVSAGGRTVTVTLETLLPATEVSAHFCRSVARSALALWPNWYDGRLNSGFALSQASDTALAAAVTSAEREWEVGLAWLRGAILACSRGALPLPGGFTDIDHLCQLAMVFGRHPRLLVTVPEQAPRVERLDALARFLVGLSEKTSFRVEFIVPAALAGSADLDPVNYLIAPPASAALSVDSEDGAAAADEPSATISAEAGRPHPESPGEQRLADWLAREWTLGPLFRFNQTVQTVRGSKYRVDLVWPEGRVVVEVDGFRTHTTPHQFRFDRQRDYELAMSGYLVLRLTHQEVMQDVALAGEKVRDMVALRRPDDGGLAIP